MRTLACQGIGAFIVVEDRPLSLGVQVLSLQESLQRKPKRDGQVFSLIKKIFIKARIFQNPFWARILFTWGFHLSFSQHLSIMDLCMSRARPSSTHAYRLVRPISLSPFRLLFILFNRQFANTFIAVKYASNNDKTQK